VPAPPVVTVAPAVPAAPVAATPPPVRERVLVPGDTFCHVSTDCSQAQECQKGLCYSVRVAP
jgi:hypothetical protein